MSGKLPYMRFFAADELAATAALSPTAMAAHFTLLLAAWVRGRPLDDDDTILSRLARLGRDEWAAARRELEAEALWVARGGLFVRDALEKERIYASALADQRRAASAKGGEARRGRSDSRPATRADGRTDSPPGAQKADQPASRTDSHSNTSPSPSPSPSPEPERKDHPSGDSSPAGTLTAPAPPDLLSGDEGDGFDIPPKLDRTTVGEAVRLWNEMAERVGLPVVQKITNDRRTKLMARLRDCGGIEGWTAAMAKVEASSFLRGERRGRGHENWPGATLDFILREGKFVLLMEGSYDDKPDGGGPRPDDHRNGFAALMAEGMPT